MSSEEIPFAQRLRNLRIASDLTQKEMGDILGISANYVGMIEKGKPIDTGTSLYKLFTVLESKGIPRAEDSSGAFSSKMGRFSEDGIPLCSWQQLAAMEALGDLGGFGKSGISLPVEESNAFAVELHGDAMSPVFDPAELVVVYPGRAVKCGDLVFARLREDLGGDLFFRIFTARKPGGRLLLGAYNPAHPAIEFDRSEFAWICPAAFSIRKLSA